MDKRFTVFLDIETVPQFAQANMKTNIDDIELPSMPTLDDMKVGNLSLGKRAEAREVKLVDALLKWDTEVESTIKKAVKECSLNPIKGKIICLVYKFPNCDPVTLRGDERTILESFNDMLKMSRGNFELVAYNGKEFDFNWLFLRAFKYKCNYLSTEFFRLNKRDHRFTDLAEVVKGFSFKQYFKFDDMCKYFGIPSPKDKMDGSEVYQYYIEGKLDEICEYCVKDVISLEALYNIFERLWTTET